MKYTVKVHRHKSQEISDYKLTANMTSDALEDFKQLHEVLHLLQDIEWIELWMGDTCIGRLLVPHEDYEEDEEDDEESLLV